MQKQISSSIDHLFELINIRQMSFRLLLEFAHALNLNIKFNTSNDILINIKNILVDIFKQLGPSKSQYQINKKANQHLSITYKYQFFTPKQIKHLSNTIVRKYKDSYMSIVEVIIKLYTLIYLGQQDQQKTTIQQLKHEFQKMVIRLHGAGKQPIQFIQNQMKHKIQSVQISCKCGQTLTEQCQNQLNDITHNKNIQIIPKSQFWYCKECDRSFHYKCFDIQQTNKKHQCRFCKIKKSISSHIIKTLLWIYVDEDNQLSIQEFFFELKNSFLKKLVKTKTMKLEIRCLQIKTNIFDWPRNCELSLNGKMFYNNYCGVQERKGIKQLQPNEMAIINRVQFKTIRLKEQKKIQQLGEGQSYLIGLFLVRTEQQQQQNKNPPHQIVVLVDNHNLHDLSFSNNEVQPPSHHQIIQLDPILQNIDENNNGIQSKQQEKQENILLQ